MKKLLLAAITLLPLLALYFLFPTEAPKGQEVAAFYDTSGDSPQGRLEWEFSRLVDPETGEIPTNMRMRERTFAAQLPKDGIAGAAAKRANGNVVWTNVGPGNVGGRTRALALDVTDENTVLAGGISGGIWRSTDGAVTWTRTSAKDQLPSVTCIAQDTRAGKTATWYAGTGEARGNSASKSFSAYYYGDGVYKSDDGGVSWELLESTISGTPQVGDVWDRVWNIATDPSVSEIDRVYAAVPGAIMLSEDGGTTWTQVRGAVSTNPFFTDVAVTSTGVAYATMSDETSDRGISRSTDGTNWVDIRPNNFPTSFNRIVMAIDPSDENIVYFLAETPGQGQQADLNDANSEYNSLWKYTYLSSDGTGSNGQWEDLSLNLPADNSGRKNYRSQGSYDMTIAVKPNDPNTVIIGGTSVFRSTDGFTSDSNTTQMGGYNPDVGGAWGYRWPNHHPDQHALIFLPSNPDILFCGSDGGVHRTTDCMADSVIWENRSIGYITSQFYTVAVDHATVGSNVVVGGLQDNGTQYTNSSDPTVPWVSPNLGDGSFCAIQDSGKYFYMSRQYASIIRAELDANGEKVAYRRIDPKDVTGYLFITPFVLDQVDNNIMYLAADRNIWRNDSLSDIPLDSSYNKIDQGWQELSNINAPQSITALATTKIPEHRLYYGTSARRLFKVEDADSPNPFQEEITNNIQSGGYTSSIAVDPRDGDKLIVVYSNYNVYSLYYTEDAGENWQRIAGNLESEQPEGSPPFFGIGDGPSCRTAAIIPVGDTQTVYMVGTSVGLFATNHLKGDSTYWVQQGVNTVGNVVVDMIDFRTEDGFVAIATHGNGVYTATVDASSDVTGIAGADRPTTKQDLLVYPNPASNHIALSFELNTPGTVDIQLLDQTGKRIATIFSGHKPAGTHKVQHELSNLATGIYFCRLTSNGSTVTRKLIKTN